jgi:integrase/recombinase XerD
LEQKFIDQIENTIYHSNLSDEQKSTLEQFKNSSLTKRGCKPRSIVPHIWLMKVLGERTKKPYIDTTEDDLDKFMLFLKTTTNQRKRKYRPRSLISFNVSLKLFFKWLYDRKGIKYDGDCPKLVSDLSTIIPRDNILHTNNLLTPLEVKRMIESCYKLRDKTILALLYETGCRAGELINLNIGDVKQERDSYDINIRISKTQPRTVYAISSYAYLKEYIESHPWKNNPQAPLFINVSCLAFGRRLLYQGLFSIVTTARKRSRLEKRVTPHLFRHSRATELASKGWTEMKLRKWFGWSATSGTPAVYIHVGQSDIKKQILKEHGLLTEDESIEDMNQRLLLNLKFA